MISIQQCDVNFLNIAKIAPKCLMQQPTLLFERPINLRAFGIGLRGMAALSCASGKSRKNLLSLADLLS